MPSASYHTPSRTSSHTPSRRHTSHITIQKHSGVSRSLCPVYPTQLWSVKVGASLPSERCDGDPLPGGTSRFSDSRPLWDHGEDLASSQGPMISVHRLRNSQSFQEVPKEVALGRLVGSVGLTRPYVLTKQVRYHILEIHTLLFWVLVSTISKRGGY
jgi:hypothetical protein